MRRALKFLHTLGALGLMGAASSLLVLLSFAPPASFADHPLMHEAMAKIAAWIFLPALALTLVAGLLAIAANPAFHNAGWVWAKAATGILIFAGGLHALAPIQEEAGRSADARAAGMNPATGSAGSEQGALWVLLAVATANVALGVWRPRFVARRGRIDR